MNWEVAKKRSKILGDIRLFFKSQNVVEVETPSLSRGTVTDPFLDAFITKYNYLYTCDTYIYNIKLSAKSLLFILGLSLNKSIASL